MTELRKYKPYMRHTFTRLTLPATLVLASILIGLPSQSEDLVLDYTKMIYEVKTAAERGGGVSVPALNLYFEPHVLRIQASWRHLLNDEKALKQFPELRRLTSKKEAVIKLAGEHDANKFSQNNIDGSIPKTLARDFATPIESMNSRRAHTAKKNIIRLNFKDDLSLTKMAVELGLTNEDLQAFKTFDTVIDHQDRYFTSRLGEAHDFGRELKPASQFYLEGAGWTKAPEVAPLQLRFAQYLEVPENFPFQHITKGLLFEPYVARKMALNKPFNEFKYEQVQMAKKPPVSAAELRLLRGGAATISRDTPSPSANDSNERFRRSKQVAKTAARVVGRALPVALVADTAYSAATSESPWDFDGAVAGAEGPAHSDYFAKNTDELFYLPIDEQGLLRLNHDQVDRAAHKKSPQIITLRCDDETISMTSIFTSSSAFGLDPMTFDFHNEHGKIKNISLQNQQLGFQFNVILDEFEKPKTIEYFEKKNGSLKKVKLSVQDLTDKQPLLNINSLSNHNTKQSRALQQMVEMVETQTPNIKKCCSRAFPACPKSTNSSGLKYAQKIELQKLNNSEIFEQKTSSTTSSK